MNWMKRIANSFEDIFGEDWKDNLPNVVSRDPQVKETTLTLWRGFNADLGSMQRSDSGYVLSPHKSEQGVMWFTHQLINGYNPQEYVQGRGKYLLEYHLPCKKHFTRIHYDDGSYYDDIPEEARGEPTENSKFYRGYELPDGWYFSYKMEKFIICSVPIIVRPDMIKLNKQYDN